MLWWRRLWGCCETFKHGQVREMGAEMAKLTLQVVVRSLFVPICRAEQRKSAGRCSLCGGREQKGEQVIAAVARGTSSLDQNTEDRIEPGYSTSLSNITPGRNP